MNMSVEIVSDTFGFSLPVGTRVWVKGDGYGYGTVVSRKDKGYRRRYSPTADYIPVRHDNGKYNGYNERHMTIIPYREAVRVWLDNSPDQL